MSHHVPSHRFQVTDRSTAATSPAPQTGLPSARRPADDASDSHAPAERPTADHIRLRAYEISQARTGLGTPGDAAGDWSQAEQELDNAVGTRL